MGSRFGRRALLWGAGALAGCAAGGVAPGEFDAAAVAEVERFEQKPERSAFALTDAQRVLARAYGYQSWSRLKAFVDGATMARFAEVVKAGDLAGVRKMLAARPELIGMDMSANDEHRALHYAVLRRDAGMCVCSCRLGRTRARASSHTAMLHRRLHSR